MNFIDHLKQNILGIVTRRAMDYAAAVNATLATWQIEVNTEQVESLFSLTGNVATDLVVSGALFLVSRYTSFKIGS